MAVMSLEQTMAVGRAASLRNCSKPATPPLSVWSHSMIHFFWSGKSGGLHGGAEVVFARDGRVETVRAGEKSDGAMPETGEMANGGVNAGGVVEKNGAGLGIVELELGKNDGNAAVHELIEHGFFFAEGHHGHAVDLALQHAARAGGQDGGIAVGGADQNLVAARDGDLFEALDQLGEEGIGDVFDDDAEQAAAAGDQGARVGVGQVVELLDGLPDAFAEAVADQRRAVHGSGDRGDGDFGHGGNGANVGEFAGGLAG